MKSFFGGIRVLTICISLSIIFVVFYGNSTYAKEGMLYSKEDCKDLGTTWKKGIVEYGCSFYTMQNKTLADLASGKDLGNIYIGNAKDLVNTYDFYTTNEDNKTPEVCADGYKKGEKDGWNGCVRDNTSGTGFVGSSSKKLWGGKSECEEKGGYWYTGHGSSCVFGLDPSILSIPHSIRNRGSIQNSIDSKDLLFTSRKDKIPDKYYLFSDSDNNKCPSGYNKKTEKKGGKSSDVCIKKGAINNPDGDDDGDGIPNSEDDDYLEPSKSDENSCEIDKVGWIICPTANFLADTVMNSYKFIADNFLEIKSHDLFAEKDDLRIQWDNFRNIANVIFVILFIIVIFSQVTSIGISNYGIKKILPRLIVFAVLINVSYYITVIMVDASNIIGKNLFNMIIGAYTWPGGGSGSTSNLGGVVATGLAGGAAAVVGATFFGGMMLAALLSAIIGTIVVVITLMIRQAVVIILVVLSPVAFASAILPNTETVFNKWKGLFKAMLVVYPVCSMVVSIATVASSILVDTAGNNPLMQGLYMTIPLVGLASSITLIKTSLAALDKITGGNLTGRLAGAEKATNKFIGNTSGIRRLNNFGKSNLNDLTGKSGKNNFLGRAGKRLGIHAAAGALRDSRVKADLGDAINEDYAKRSMRDSQMAVLEGKEASGVISAREQQYLNSIRSQKHKESQDLINAKAEDLKSSFGMSAGMYETSLASAFKSGNTDEIVSGVRALGKSGLSAGDQAKVLSSVVGGLDRSQLQNEGLKRAVSMIQPELGSIRNKDMVTAQTLNEAASKSPGDQIRTRSEIANDIKTYTDASAELLSTQGGHVTGQNGDMQTAISLAQQNDSFTQDAQQNINSKIDLMKNNPEVNSKIGDFTNIDQIAAMTGYKPTAQAAQTKYVVLNKPQQSSQPSAQEQSVRRFGGGSSRPGYGGYGRNKK